MSPHFLCEEVRLLATCLQVVEELLKPRPKYAVPSVLGSGGMKLKVQSSPLLYNKFKSSVNYMLKTKIVRGVRERYGQMFLEIDFQG